MAADDDSECVEHVWEMAEFRLSWSGAAVAETCGRCGAVSYEPEGENIPRLPAWP